MSGSAGAAYLITHKNDWSNLRKYATAALWTVPIAVISDNASIDFQKLKLFIGHIPKAEYAWRSHMFAGTILAKTPLPDLAVWVNQQIVPGLINGYLVGIALAGAAVVTNILWNRHTEHAIEKAGSKVMAD